MEGNVYVPSGGTIVNATSNVASVILPLLETQENTQFIAAVTSMTYKWNPFLGGIQCLTFWR